MEILFYDVKTRQKIGVPVADVKKTTFERQTKEGATQLRYALKALHNGTKLMKFVSKADWESLDVPKE